MDVAVAGRHMAVSVSIKEILVEEDAHRRRLGSSAPRLDAGWCTPNLGTAL